MCGRFTITYEAEDLRAALDLASIPDDFIPRFNIAPSQPILAVTDANLRAAQWMRWGLVPSWAKDASIGNRMINARAETVTEKPAFRQAFSHRRCLLPADGFYEWKAPQSAKGPRLPFYFSLSGRKPFFFAGLWEVWSGVEGNPLYSATILTTSANETVAPVHDRMPVILTGANAWNWLSDAAASSLLELLRPYAASEMQTVPVSPLVNNPAVDRPDCVFPAAQQSNPSLFG